MTIGTGIFCSTVLLVLVFGIQRTTAHHKWKLVGKVAGLIVAAFLVIGLGYYLWNYVENLPPAPSVMTELVGVKLGMSPTDVTLVLGKPDTTTEPSFQAGETRFDYSYPDQNLSITFYGADKYHAKANIICTSQPFAKVLGFDNLSSEQFVLQRLGKPSSTSVSRDGLSKIDSYAQWKVSFFISKGMISEKCLTSSGGMSFSEELLTPDQQKAADAKAAAEKAAQDRATAEAFEKAQQQAASASAAKAVNLQTPSGEGLSADPSDPCAPGLTKSQRLHRLAAFGAVRETGSEAYEAGPHDLTFAFGSLVYCH